jgi:outer membrane immunogenic protein
MLGAYNWVAGLEADWQASGEKASRSFDPLLVTSTAVTNYEAKISWFGTLRGRIGYVWDRWMLYATGGLAYGEVKLAGTTTVSGTVGGTPFAVVTSNGRSQVMQVGPSVRALKDH